MNIFKTQTFRTIITAFLTVMVLFLGNKVINNFSGVDLLGATVRFVGNPFTEAISGGNFPLTNVSNIQTGYLLATSTTATSTFAGPAVIAKSRILQVGSGNNYVPSGGNTPSYVIVDRTDAGQDASVLYSTNGQLYWELGNPGDNDLHIKSVSGTESGGYTFTDRLWISKTTGAIGLGTVIPTGNMELKASSSASRVQLTVTNSQSNGTGVNGDQIVFSNQAGTNFYMGTDAGLNGGQNFFMNWGTFATGLFMDSTGKIGIATTAPAYTLDVNGSTQLGSGGLALVIDNNGNVGIGTSTNLSANLQISSNMTNSTSSLIIGKSGQNKGGCVLMYNSAGTATYCSISGTTWGCSATSCF